MEIDIPNLDDVEFEKNCSICYGKGKREVGHKEGRKWTYTTEDCEYCGGNGIVVSEVGHKLIAFLKARGVTLTEKV